MRHEYIWGICTGEVEKLLQDEKSPAPGQGAASGGIQSCKTKMRPTDETYLANLTLSDGGKALPPGRAPRRGERANRFEESIISRKIPMKDPSPSYQSAAQPASPEGKPFRENFEAIR